MQKKIMDFKHSTSKPYLILYNSTKSNKNFVFFYSLFLFSFVCTFAVNF